MPRRKARKSEQPADTKPAAKSEGRSSKKDDQITEALNTIFENRTSPYLVADSCLAIWKAVHPRRKWNNEAWANHVSGR